MTGTTGCNEIGAGYDQSGDQGQDITFDARFTSQVYCADEPPVLDRLSAVRHISGAASTRYLQGDNHQTIIELTRR